MYENHPKNFDHDENYKIMVTRGREMIDSTLTQVNFSKSPSIHWDLIRTRFIEVIWWMNIEVLSPLSQKGYVIKALINLRINNLSYDSRPILLY